MPVHRGSPSRKDLAPTNQNLRTPANPGNRPIRPLGVTTCTDTMGHILTTETNSMLGVDYITQTRDGNILAPGYQWNVTSPFYTFPYLVKYTPQGTILWSKSFAGLGIYPQNNAYAYKCFELNDGSLLLAGLLSIPEKVNGRYELAMWRLDANGNMIWVQTDSCSIWAQYSGSLEVVDLQQDPAGNIYLAGNQRAFDANTSGSFALKMDLAGNIQWDKSFTSRFSSCFGMLWTGGELAMVGSSLDGMNTEFLWFLTIDPATGDTLRSKTWVQDYGAGTTWYSFSALGSARLLANGNISVCGPPLSDFAQTTNPLIHGVIAEFDPSFNYLRGWMIKSNIQSNYGNTRITEHPSGRISYTYLKYISGYDMDIFYGAVEQGQITKERVLHQRNRSNAWTSNFVNVAGNEDVVIQSYGDPVNNVSGQEFVRLYDSDTSSVCSGIDTLASWVEPFVMTPYRGSDWESVFSNTFRRTDRPMPPPVDGNPIQQMACASTSFCRSLQLSVDQDQVCAGSPAVFTALRNTGCGGRPLWFFDTTNIQSYQLLSDTTLRIIYRGQHQGAITAAMTGTCSNLSVSKQLTVMAAYKPVSLGGDHYLCPDSILVLRPAKGYSSYLWQDGSVADTLVVTAPGAYTVTVTNICGTPSSDTASVKRAPPVDFPLGPDLPVCLADSVTLHTPDGFTDYSWTSLDGETVYNAQNITVSPAANTQYFARARTPLGCTVKNSIAITIKMPLAIHLGKDTSICKGDSLLLDAGASFLNYLWNNGAITEKLFAHDAGAYSVKAQSPNGCFSKDTLRVSISTNRCRGIYFPNAFDPNGNGANHLFRSHASGNIIHYHLQVFNRWGQMVFTTEDYSRGWDGRVNNIAQPAGTYVWISHYQFADEPEKIEKG
ncbi:MAG TPA: gliding motility-associated C-terminal domain-containing protein, partial [Puia sp.]|nr:gliding motility-associated C-terminal domain-containing protein [Puia sp.]